MSPMSPSLSRGASSATLIRDAWYVASTSTDLGRAPVAREVAGLPIVLFRDGAGRAGALLDRCPHRNVPLSLGKVREGALECAYHGWRFDREGTCLAVPSLCGAPEAEARRAPALAVRERDGYVWVWPSLEVEPEGEPFHFELAAAPGYAVVRENLHMDASLQQVAENALDVPHTAFLHAGLFRGPARRHRIDVEVRRSHDRVEAHYRGEPRPGGLVGRILAPGGGEVEHTDRFILPSIVQVEYRLGNTHLLVTAALTPESERRTRLYALIAFKLPVPAFALVPVVKPLALKIFQQDAVILARQSEVIARFGGEQFVSTEVDVLGPQILRLLRQAERGKLDQPGEPTVRHFEMEV